MSRKPTVFTQDAARKIKRAVLRSEREFAGNDLTGGGRHQTTWNAPARIRFKNTHSGTCPHHAIMRITGGSTDEYLNCTQPDSTYRWLYVVNIDGEVGANKLGWCSFLTLESFSWENNYVLYDTANTPAYGQRWGPVASSWYLGQHRPGFFVFGVNKGSGNGVARTLAIQLPPAEVRVKNDTGSDKAAASTATYSLFGGSAGTTDLGLDIEATNDMSISFKSNKYGSVGNVNGKDYVITWQT